MRLHCAGGVAVVVLSSNFLRACNQHGVKRRFHEAGSLPIEFSIKLVVCHHRGGAARAGPDRTGRSIRAQQADPPAGPPPDGVRRRWGARLVAKQYYGRGHRW